MASYIDLVLVNDGDSRVVCKAPWLASLEKGMQVRFSVGDCVYDGYIVGVMDGIDKDDDNTINFVLACAKQEELGKVRSKIEVVDFEYEDEDDA